MKGGLSFAFGGDLGQVHSGIPCRPRDKGAGPAPTRRDFDRRDTQADCRSRADRPRRFQPQRASGLPEGDPAVRPP